MKALTKLKFDTGNIGLIERGITPPMKAAITIPELTDPQKGFAVYVAQSPWPVSLVRSRQTEIDRKLAEVYSKLKVPRKAKAAGK